MAASRWTSGLMGVTILFMLTYPVASDAARAFLRLHLVDGLGPILTGRLIERFGDVHRVLAASRAELESVRGIGHTLADRIAAADPAAAEREIDLAARHGARIICSADEDYPVALRAIPDPPVCLYVRGDVQRTDAVAIGIVGSRTCTLYAREQAERFGMAAAEVGLTVVSGMAAGVDTAAHRGALRARGRTLAVMGCGLCHVYPPNGEALAAEIAGSGAVLSEFPMQTVPAEQNFPRRNRIIAGLSLGVVVVEASHRSGALITAHLANEYNREVFAIPGRIDTNHARGCHDLIRRGEARLVTNIMDVLDELGEVGRTLASGLRHGDSRDAAADATADADAQSGRLFGTAIDAASDAPGASIGRASTGVRRSESSPPLADDEQVVLAAMTPDEPAGFERLSARTDLAPSRVAAALTTLQLKRRITRDAAGQFVRRRD